MINSVVLVGRLTKDPELRKTPSNKSVSSFVLACDKPIRSNDNNNNADFISCVAWNQSAEYLCNYGKKGSIVSVQGRIQTRNYDNQQGQKVYVTEVLAERLTVITRSNSNSNTSQYNANQSHANDNSQVRTSNADQTFTPSSNISYSGDNQEDSSPALDISSDDLPFY